VWITTLGTQCLDPLGSELSSNLFLSSDPLELDIVNRLWPLYKQNSSNHFSVYKTCKSKASTQFEIYIRQITD
jgi:hypothetical protein